MKLRRLLAVLWSVSLLLPSPAGAELETTVSPSLKRIPVEVDGKPSAKRYLSAGSVTLRDRELELDPYEMEFVTFDLTPDAGENSKVTMTFVCIPINGDTFDFSPGRGDKDAQVLAALGSYREFVAGDPLEDDGREVSETEIFSHERKASLGGTCCLPCKGDKARYKWYLPVAITEVTNAQYHAVMNPGTPYKGNGAQCPVVNLTNEQVAIFVSKLNSLLRAELAALWKDDAKLAYRFRFRLPTDDEWEFAARGGCYLDGRGSDEYLAYASEENSKYGENRGDGVIAVQGGRERGGKPPYDGRYNCNYCGLYDMLGNANELVAAPFHFGTRFGDLLVRGCGSGRLTAATRHEEAAGCDRSKVGFRLVIGSGLLGRTLRSSGYDRTMGDDASYKVLMEALENEYSLSSRNPATSSPNAELDRLRKSEKKSLASIRELNERIRVLEEQIAKAKEQGSKESGDALAAAESRCRTLQEQLAGLQKELEVLRNKKSPSTTQIAGPSHDYAALQKKVSDLAAQLEKQEQDKKRLQAENASYRKRIASLEHLEESMEEQAGHCRELNAYLARILVRELHNIALFSLKSHDNHMKQLSVLEKARKLPDSNSRKRGLVENADRAVEVERRNGVKMYERFVTSLEFLTPIDASLLEGELEKLEREIRQDDAKLKIGEISLDRQIPVLELVRKEIQAYVRTKSRPSLKHWDDTMSDLWKKHYDSTSTTQSH